MSSSRLLGIAELLCLVRITSPNLGTEVTGNNPGTKGSINVSKLTLAASFSQKPLPIGGGFLAKIPYPPTHCELLQPRGWAAFPSAALPYITQSSPFWLCNPFCLFGLLVCWSPGSLLSPPLQRSGSGSCSLWALPDASALPHLSDKPPPPPRSRHILPSSLLSPIRRTIYTAQSRSSCFPILNRGVGLWGTESFLDFSSHGVGEGAAMAPQAAVLLHPGTLSSSASHSQVLAHSALGHLFWLLTAETLPPSAFSSPHWLSLFSDGINRACPWANPFSIAGRCLGTVFPQHQKECVLTHSCRARAWKWRNETSLSPSEQDLSNTTSFGHTLSQFFPR